MNKYLVEFAFAENFAQVEEWQTIDGLEWVEAESPEDAVKEVEYTDGLENVLFRVSELTSNEFGGFEKSGKLDILF